MRRRTLVTSGVVLAGVVLLFAVRGRHQPVASAPVSQPPIAGVSSELARVVVDSAEGALEIVIGPVSLAPATNGLRTPVQLVELPVSGSVNAFSWRMTDARGRRLSNDLLHHVNLIDPDRRELFSPIARRVAAAGRETAPQEFPALLGYPLQPGTRMLVVAMFANPGPTAVPDAYLRVRLEYSRADGLIPPLPIYPFYLDVMGPVGEKSFPVPPGRTERSWVGTPAVDARVLAIGGHLHDHATSLTLEDVATGRVIWRAEPRIENGRILAIPTSMTWKKGGFELKAGRRYRIRAQYHNPTGQPTPHGGMGVIAGVAHIGARWPALRRTDSDYTRDLAGVIAAPARAGAHDHAHMH